MPYKKNIWIPSHWLLSKNSSRTTEWDEFEWSKRVVHVTVTKQTKWWVVLLCVCNDQAPIRMQDAAPSILVFLWKWTGSCHPVNFLNNSYKISAFQRGPSVFMHLSIKGCKLISRLPKVVCQTISTSSHCCPLRLHIYLGRRSWCRTF